ncbi:MAG: adenylate/guanylate cyclase domain-containing protein [Betaproteobacteria bacterium]|nr:adenylate/guanylate cyclase domain-containing protein [Betaproteobacteria bacterium]
MRLFDFCLNFSRRAGLAGGDPEGLRLQKSLLVFASGLFWLAFFLWCAISWSIGPDASMAAPCVFLALILVNLAVHLKTGKFEFFRDAQLTLFLTATFVSQWSAGGFFAAGGVALLGLSVPVYAALCLDAKGARFWFLAYLALMLFSGAMDDGVSFFTGQKESEEPVRASLLLFSFNFAAISTMVYLLLRYAAAKRQGADSRLAGRLDGSEEAAVENFPEVSVMFVDVVDFTELSGALPPSKVFSLLNRLFSAFDELAEKYGVETIKTIGDAYMAASGLEPAGEQACHAEAIAALALEIRECLRLEAGLGGIRLQVRIGIASGAVAAGVMGGKRRAYDLWGDTVNLARRIASDAAPGAILVDAATHSRLCRGFRFSGIQTAQIKGKGEVRAFPLEGVLEGQGRLAPRERKS